MSIFCPLLKTPEIFCACNHRQRALQLPLKFGSDKRSGSRAISERMHRHANIHENGIIIILDNEFSTFVADWRFDSSWCLSRTELCSPRDVGTTELQNSDQKDVDKTLKPLDKSYNYRDLYKSLHE